MMEWLGEITSWKQPSCNIPDKHGEFLFLLHQIDIKLHYTKDTSITIDNYQNFLHCTRIHQYNVYGQNIANFVHGTPMSSLNYWLDIRNSLYILVNSFWVLVGQLWFPVISRPFFISSRRWNAWNYGLHWKVVISFVVLAFKSKCRGSRFVISWQNVIYTGDFIFVCKPRTWKKKLK